MSKGKGKQYATREEWLAVRASPSMGRTLRDRERFIHVSTRVVERPAGSGNFKRISVTYKKAEDNHHG